MKTFLKKIKRNLLAQTEESVNNFQKISYSQSGEDLIVKYIFDNLGITKPSYLDVGAHHPFYISNTALFYQNGSVGINIEPDPTLFKAFIRERKKDQNLNIGISNKEDVLDFFIISSPTLNTFSKEEAHNYQKEGDYKIERIEKIKVKTLSNVLNEFCKGIFPQFLSIDAEGVDEVIIKEIDFEKNFPLVICLETISFSTTGNGIKNVELINYITSKGYLAYADTYINTIFVKKDQWQK
ncbi:FkbM family methyltransferase [Flavobacterium johnsoniae]|uniref:FkbM family methyltransferase n=1 Tax=Flavobacterium johnsoniae TaxID=986 RepID=UPI0025B0AA28|nr:FkbM family methyltransferase [Flavobacterium johnsoniae]WJS95140.1 FkbM family methyltransferase [Flavobacterium johnsoniae]